METLKKHRIYDVSQPR
jgi:hypothetical protein